MMSFKDLAKIGKAQEDLMPDTVYIQRLTRTSDGAGGWAESWQTVATTKGRISARQNRSGEDLRAGRWTAFGEYIVTLPKDTELDQDARLQIDGRQYEVRAILKRSEQTTLRVLVEIL